MSLAVRLAAAFVAVVAVVALIFGAVGVVATGSGATRQVDQFLADRAEDLIDGSRGRPTVADITLAVNETTGGKNRGKGKDAFDPDAVVQTVDVDGLPLVSTGPTLPVGSDELAIATSVGTDPRNSIDQANYRTIELDGDQYRMITAALPEGGAVQVARELSESNTLVGLIRSQLLLAILAVAAIAAVGGIALARRITQPLRSLAASVDAVAATGDLNVPITVEGDDEVGRVAAGFERLLNSLARSRQQQQQLVQDAAHELRTPLTSIKANVDLLAAAPDLDRQTRLDSVKSAQTELRELARLVDEIVDVATDRYSRPPSEPVDLSTVAADALDRFMVRVPDRTVETELSSPVVTGDAESLSRAVGNLLANADKYSPTDQPIRLTVNPDGRVAVADRGPGIPVEDRERVFDRFYRADSARSQPGSGLGLSIVASIVEDHGGRVGIDDRPGGGVEVWFTVPPAP
jgi:two-component system sensor histidine kinase MprB